MLILAHRGEIVKQNAAAVKRLGGHCGLVLASEGHADMRARITSAMVNSLHAKLKRPRGRIEPWDYALVDEAHTVPVKGEGMYRTILRGPHCAQARQVGVTATPSRLDGGPIYPEPGEEVGDRQFTELAYELGMDDLVRMTSEARLLLVRASPSVCNQKAANKTTPKSAPQRHSARVMPPTKKSKNTPAPP